MYYKLMEAFAALLVLLPCFLLLNRVVFHSRRRTALYFLFALYLAAVYHLTGLPTVLFITFDVNLNLIPFEIFTKELALSLLNMAMFVPLGFFLPLFLGRYRSLKSTILFGLGATVTIELAQLLTYRATDINDVITNSLGCVLGFACFRLLEKMTGRAVPPWGKQRELRYVFLCTAAAMFFLQPPLAAFLYQLT